MKHYVIIKFGRQTSNRHGPNSFGKLSHQKLSASIPGIFTFRSLDNVQVQSVLSFDVSHESPSLLPGVWQHKNWFAVSDGGLSSKVKESLHGGAFSNRQNLQLAKCDA